MGVKNQVRQSIFFGNEGLKNPILKSILTTVSFGSASPFLLIFSHVFHCYASGKYGMIRKNGVSL